MEITSWQKVLISWANSLGLLNEPIKNILDLVKSSFFINLVNKVKNVKTSSELYIPEEHVYKVIENFLEIEYSGYILLGYWDTDEVILISSVFLLWTCVASKDLRIPLYGLNVPIQVQIQLFIERFLEMPPHLINRQEILAAVLDIVADDGIDDESSNIIKSNSRMPSLSYTPGVLFEVRRLRDKINSLIIENEHLKENLAVTKSKLFKKQNTCESKVAELNLVCINLIRNSSASGNKCFVGDIYQPPPIQQKSECMKLYLNEFTEVIKLLSHEARTQVEDIKRLHTELMNLDTQQGNNRKTFPNDETKSLQVKIEELESFISLFRNACDEMNLRVHISQEKYCTSEHSALEAIGDVKCSSIEGQINFQTELLEEKSKLIQLLEENESGKELVKTLSEDIKYLKQIFSLMTVDDEQLDYRQTTILNEDSEHLLDENSRAINSEYDDGGQLDDVNIEYLGLEEEMIRRNSKIVPGLSAGTISVATLTKSLFADVESFSQIDMSDHKIDSNEFSTLKCEVSSQLDKCSKTFKEVYCQCCDDDTLGSILDSKYSKMEEKFKNHNDLLEAKSNQVDELIKDKASSKIVIEKLTEEINVLNQIIVSMNIAQTSDLIGKTQVKENNGLISKNKNNNESIVVTMSNKFKEAYCQCSEGEKVNVSCTKLSQMEEKIKLITELLGEKTNYVEELLLEKVSAEGQIKKLSAEVRHVNETLCSMSMVEKSQCKECTILEEIITTLLSERSKTHKEVYCQYYENETLESIIDSKVFEMEKKVKLQTKLLEEKSIKVEELLVNKIDSDRLIEKLSSEVKEVNHTLSIMANKSECDECRVLKQDISKITLSFHDICNRYAEIEVKHEIQTDLAEERSKLVGDLLRENDSAERKLNTLSVEIKELRQVMSVITCKPQTSKMFKEEYCQYGEGLDCVVNTETAQSMKLQELLEEKSKLVANLLNEKVWADKLIEKLYREVKEVNETLYSMNHGGQKSECKECTLLKQDIETLKSYFTDKCNSCTKLQESSEQKCSVIRETEVNTARELQEQFDKFESVLYLEERPEDLPQSLQEEVKIWSEHSPHIRVLGKKAILNERVDVADTEVYDNFEEVFETHGTLEEALEKNISNNDIVKEVLENCSPNEQQFLKDELKSAAVGKLFDEAWPKVLDRVDPLAVKALSAGKTKIFNEIEKQQLIDSTKQLIGRSNSSQSYSREFPSRGSYVDRTNEHQSILSSRGLRKFNDRVNVEDYPGSHSRPVPKTSLPERKNNTITTYSARVTSNVNFEVNSSPRNRVRPSNAIPKSSYQPNKKTVILPPIETLAITPKKLEKRSNSASIRFTKHLPLVRPNTSKNKEMSLEPMEVCRRCRPCSKYKSTKMKTIRFNAKGNKDEFPSIGNLQVIGTKSITTTRDLIVGMVLWIYIVGLVQQLQHRQLRQLL